MTTKTEVMEMLRNNVLVMEIGKKFRGKSMLFEYLTDYLRELADKIDGITAALQQERARHWRKRPDEWCGLQQPYIYRRQ